MRAAIRTRCSGKTRPRRMRVVERDHVRPPGPLDPRRRAGRCRPPGRRSIARTSTARSSSAATWFAIGSAIRCRASTASRRVISGLELYRLMLAGAPGYRPSQFSIVSGDPAVSFSIVEGAWFAQDDWRAASRLTVSYGIRHEIQQHGGAADAVRAARGAGLGPVGGWQLGGPSRRRPLLHARFLTGCSPMRCAWTAATASGSSSIGRRSSRACRMRFPARRTSPPPFGRSRRISTMPIDARLDRQLRSPARRQPVRLDRLHVAARHGPAAHAQHRRAAVPAAGPNALIAAVRVDGTFERSRSQRHRERQYRPGRDGVWQLRLDARDAGHRRSLQCSGRLIQSRGRVGRGAGAAASRVVRRVDQPAGRFRRLPLRHLGVGAAVQYHVRPRHELRFGVHRPAVARGSRAARCRCDAVRRLQSQPATGRGRHPAQLRHRPDATSPSTSRPRRCSPPTTA